MKHLFKKICIASDHGGFYLKEEIKDLLVRKNISIFDLGPLENKTVDYPDFAHELAKAISSNDCDFGIQFCGSGNGINMSANKHQAIRSALCWKTDIAEQARLHNNANICTMPARYISYEEVQSIVNAFLSTEFEGGRHERRVKKIACC